MWLSVIKMFAEHFEGPFYHSGDRWPNADCVIHLHFMLEHRLAQYDMQYNV